MDRLLTLIAIAFCMGLPAANAAPTALGKYENWTVFKDTVGGETLCYAVTSATDKAPRSADHGDVLFYVTSWQSGRKADQPSLRVGYELRDDLPGKARVGRQSWALFPVGRDAYSQDQDDPKLVRALEKGRELRVEATSDRNTRVAYHFSLSGSSAAIKRARSACRG